MNTVQFDIGGGASVALPRHLVAKNLLESLETQSQTIQHRGYQLGEYIIDQGGIFAGDIRGDDGVTYGLIISQEEDIGCATWGPEGERDLSDWDGLNNTARLRNECPAAKLASDYKAGGNIDFYLPGRREMLVAMANLPHLFNKDSWYWTSTPYGRISAWAVDFENGSVSITTRYYEFRVRPFRRFTY